MINSQENGPEIKREQVKQPPDLTDDTRLHRREEERYGLSIPIMVGLIGLVFIVVIIAALLIW